MYLHDTRLTPRLTPDCYGSQEFYDVERRTLGADAWHLVGSRTELARPGDFLTCELWGQPVQVRNFDGRLAALANVCAHRHCLLTHAARGASRRMACQYHGWEYDVQGRATKIPEPKNFAPFDGSRFQLPAFRVECCGDLVFVTLGADGPSLRERMGEFYDECAERFGAGWREFLAWEPTIPTNWKIPIENSLESYHVPCVHPETFRVDPGSLRSEHRLESDRTSFRTRLPFSPHSRLDACFQSAERWFLRRLGEPATGQYMHHHLFPNLLFSFTDAISLCQCVTPTGPRSCRLVVRQFGRRGSAATSEGAIGGGWLRRASEPLRRRLASAWGGLAAGITRRIVQEDLALFEDVQRGLDASARRGGDDVGALGSCEERIHQFQTFVAEACALAVADHPTGERA